jgi:luciferase-type oxidoreductase
MDHFSQHPGYRRLFKENHMTLGLFFPIEAYTGSIPRMDLDEQIKLAKRAEELNFGSLVIRDVPLHDPYFGDVGQIYDPWVFLGYIAANTDKIALLTGSIILTLRHPLHVAKAAASVDKISGGRLVLGVATGDRPVEFPSFNVDFEQRAELFREAMSVIREVWKTEFPVINTARVNMSKADLIPKPDLYGIPMLVTGHSGQSIEWIAKHADGWMYYPRNITFQMQLIQNYRSLMDGFKPFAQSLYIDLTEDPDVDPTPIHLGFRTGRKFLIRFLQGLQEIGVNHVMLNLKYGHRPAAEVIEELGEEVLPLFPALTGDE